MEEEVEGLRALKMRVKADEGKISTVAMEAKAS